MKRSKWAKCTLRDQNLNRTVAIKVLPPDLTSDRHRVQRFEQEARSASASNHPNVASSRTGPHWRGGPVHRHGVHRGETLRARLLRGRLKRKELLDIAVQIGSGLAAAQRLAWCIGI